MSRIVTISILQNISPPFVEPVFKNDSIFVSTEKCIKVNRGFFSAIAQNQNSFLHMNNVQHSSHNPDSTFGRYETIRAVDIFNLQLSPCKGTMRYRLIQLREVVQLAIFHVQLLPAGYKCRNLRQSQLDFTNRRIKI